MLVHQPVAAHMPNTGVTINNGHTNNIIVYFFCFNFLGALHPVVLWLAGFLQIAIPATTRSTTCGPFLQQIFLQKNLFAIATQIHCVAASQICSMKSSVK